MYTDPSGQSFFGIEFIVGAMIGSVISGAQSDWNPEAMLVGAVVGGVSGGTYSGISGFVGDWAGSSLAGSVQAGTISSTTSGILSGAAGGAAGGAAAGAVTGGMSAAYYGGNVGDEMLRGAGLGSVGGAAFGGIGAGYGNKWSWDRVVVSGLAGGGVNELAGSRFMDGFMFAAVPVVARALYNEWVNYDATWESGGDVVKKRWDTYPVEGANNVGVQGDPNHWAREGSFISRLGNRIPGVNAVAGSHDVFQVNLDIHLGNFARNVFNVPGMLPAAAITYSALMTDYALIVSYQTVLMRDDRR